MWNGEKVEWLNYSGSRDLTALELCLRYADSGHFIVPRMSCSFSYSRGLYNQRVGRDLERFIKANKEYPFDMVFDSIDCEQYQNDWQNLKGISVECLHIAKYPYYSDCIEDTLIYRLENDLLKS